MKINKVIFFALSFLFVSFINAQTFTWTGSSNSLIGQMKVIGMMVMVLHR